MGVADRLPYGGEDELIRRVEVLEAQVRAFGAAELLRAAGIVAEADILRVLGNLRVEGTLDLPAGIVGNDALQSPVVFGGAGLSDANFAVTTAGTARAEATIDIPEGFTQALVFCHVGAGSVNSGPGPDYLTVRAEINGTPGGGLLWLAGPGDYVSGAATAIRTLTGLAGGQIAVAARLNTTQTNWAQTGTAIAHTDAVVVFTR